MTEAAQNLVIVGSGLGAWTVAREFRKLDAQASITVITRDSGDYYSKPLLSAAFANGKTAGELVSSTGATIAQQLAVTLLADTEVTTIDPANSVIQTSRGPIAYQRLGLALGAGPLRLPIQGNAADRVLSVNDWQDYAHFRQRLEGARRVTILGAGLIGCEFANDLITGGFEVDVIDPGTQPLGRMLPPAAGALVQQVLTQAGVRFHFGTTAQAVHAKGQGVEVELSNGQRLASDVVLSAVGLRPRIALAQAAGLQTARGIVVDRQLQTSQPGIYALGDVAEVEGQWLPFILPVMQAARTLAAHLAGQDVVLRYPAMPVVVKTPIVPIVVSPPAAGAAGQWQVEASTDGVDARFVGEDGALLGFALVGKATAHKTALQKALPAILA